MIIKKTQSKSFLLMVLAFVVLAQSLYIILNVGKKQPTPITPPPVDETVFCTTDAMLCPDGSYVARVAPNCNFAPCPETETPVSDNTPTRQTYKSDKYGISFTYPKESKIMGDINSHLFTIISENQVVSFLASDNPQNFDVSEFFLRLISPSDPDSVRDYVSFSDAKINGTDFILFNQDANYFSQQSLPLNGYLVKSGDYVISFNFGTRSESLLNQILSTFEFIN